MNKKGTFLALVSCLLVLLLVNNGYTQGCCGIGGSLVSGGHPVLDKNTFLISASGNYADANNPERQRSGTGMMLAYGITDRLALSLKTSYVWASYSFYQKPVVVNGEQLSPGQTVNYRNNGFGDGYAAIQYAIIRLTPMNKQELIAGMDVGIPWGPDGTTIIDADGNKTVLIDNVQTGTGGFSLNGFLTYLKAFPTIYYSIASTIAGRVNFETRRGKEPGNEFSVMVTSLFGPFFNTRESITFSYYQTDTTINEFKQAVTVSAGKRFSLIPALEYSILSNLKLSLSADIPLWRDKNQALVGNNKLLKAEIYWFIHSADN
jgi:hypothetical protein